MEKDFEIEEQILKELNKLKNSTFQIEEAKKAAHNSNESFRQIEEQYRNAQVNWANEREEINNQIDLLKTKVNSLSLEKRKASDNENSDDNSFSAFIIKLRLLKENVKELEKREEESWEEIKEMVEKKIANETLYFKRSIISEKSEMEKNYQKEIERLKVIQKEIKKQNNILWIFATILIVFSILQLFMVFN